MLTAIVRKSERALANDLLPSQARDDAALLLISLESLEPDRVAIEQAFGKVERSVVALNQAAAAGVTLGILPEQVGDLVAQAERKVRHLIHPAVRGSHHFCA